MVTDLELVGGNLALDLANTLEGPIDAPPDTDHLRTPADLAAWAGHVGLEPPRQPTGQLLVRTHELRAAIYATFRAVVAHDDPPREALDTLAEHAAGARLVAAGGRFELSWDGDLLAPIAQAAVDLLRTGPLDRVKLCHDCCWLFVDASRNRSRRWCSMNECGGRSKMRRYRARRATAGR